ncbi:uncharacterized protein LOC135140406 [Zophobas morio]|uniref:uncharacterized protein LOC135140406 n=1 Tax=Zophobas morio TaxID=2755281 RepID=UPI003082A0CC
MGPFPGNHMEAAASRGVASATCAAGLGWGFGGRRPPLGVWRRRGWKRALPDDQLEVFLSGGTRRSELVCLRAQVHFYGYLLVESAANGATPDGESVHLWRGLLEVVGCIVSITPIGSAVQPANFPRLGLFHPEDDENGF